MPDKPLLAILGPTATGKTEVGMLVAEALGGEIISADSMLVYRGMDIGTAKPTLEQRAHIPHHLIDIVDPDESFSVVDYQERTITAIAEIRGRGRQPLLVGGSGLYLRAVIDALGIPISPPDPELRRKLSEEARVYGPAALHERLAKVDPEAAARLHPNDEKRIIRALEVFYNSGIPISQLHALDRQSKARYNARKFGLILTRSELYRRIDTRVDLMLKRGLVNEVESLLKKSYRPDLVSMRGLGYAHLTRYLQGDCSQEEAVALFKRDTRRFAKRQLTWFRADKSIEWIDVAEYGGAQGTAEFILQRWEAKCD